MVLLLASCTISGGDDRYVVEMTVQNQFNPASLTVPVGATVTWHNASTIPHTVTADPARAHGGVTVQLPEGAQPWNSGDVYAGDDWSYTFDTPGQYVYFCDFHPAQGMIGTINVIAPDATR